MSPETIGWVLAVALVGLLVTVYLSWTAGRIDRMHARLETARASLDAQRHRRSSVAIEIAVAGLLDPASAVLVADSAHRARAAAPGEEELAENDLTRALMAAFAEALEPVEPLEPLARSEPLDPLERPERPEPAPLDRVDARHQDPGQDLLDELTEVGRRLQLARRFHNDAVRATGALRAHRVVRWLSLAGHAPAPRPIDFDDSIPLSLSAPT